MTNADAVLDAEYRALVRSLHKDTIDTIIAVESWWEPHCFRAVTLGAYAPDDQDPAELPAETVKLEDQWRNELVPKMSTLIYGHPDPDVRDAADFLVKRLWSMIMILHKYRKRRRQDEDENSVAVHLVHDGFERLRRAAYHAPFRIERPVPRFDGIRVGNFEPLPGKMLELIRQFQDAGVLEKDDENDILGSRIPQAVKRLSDIFFMSKEQRTALLQPFDVDDPAVAEPERGDPSRKFGFTFDD
ncbi:hypothetical protein ACFWM1_28420 [Nocardia sp. NPDC058379]|uniref:hypothetical protein n=1 Tax=unclassified Nocardia TaxID=2637762 RepID=UPI0036583EFD